MEAQKRKMCKITGIWDDGRSCSGDDKAKNDMCVAAFAEEKQNC